MPSPKPTIDTCAQQGRAVLCAIFFALLAVATLVLASAFGALDAWSEGLHRSAPLLPLAIILFCAWARQKQHHPGGASARAALWKAMHNDEFRQRNNARAIRVGFVVLLLIQLPLAFALGQAWTPPPIAMLACLSMLAGAIAFLGAFLYFERADA